MVFLLFIKYFCQEMKWSYNNGTHLEPLLQLSRLNREYYRNLNSAPTIQTTANACTRVSKNLLCHQQCLGIPHSILCIKRKELLLAIAQSFPNKENWIWPKGANFLKMQKKLFSPFHRNLPLKSSSKVLWLVWSSASLPLWANSYIFLYEMIKHIFFPLANPPAKVLPYLLGELLLLLGREFNVV